MMKHWSEYEGFQNLQERILSLRMILEGIPYDTINQGNKLPVLLKITFISYSMTKSYSKNKL